MHCLKYKHNSRIIDATKRHPDDNTYWCSIIPFNHTKCEDSLTLLCSFYRVKNSLVCGAISFIKKVYENSFCVAILYCAQVLHVTQHIIWLLSSKDVIFHIEIGTSGYGGGWVLQSKPTYFQLTFNKRIWKYFMQDKIGIINVMHF